MNAKKFSLQFGAMLWFVCALTGCYQPHAGGAHGTSGEQSARNNGYSLLHQLLDEQKDVSMLRFIKREHTDVKKLVNKIASTSGRGAKLLEDFARDDSTISLNDIGLPPAEIATRKAIASTKKKELLGETGDEFELALLLSQTEALSYAWHLAKVTGENESDPKRAQALSRLSNDMQNLYFEVCDLLLSKEEKPTTNQTKIHP